MVLDVVLAGRCGSIWPRPPQADHDGLVCVFRCGNASGAKEDRRGGSRKLDARNSSERRDGLGRPWSRSGHGSAAVGSLVDRAPVRPADPANAQHRATFRGGSFHADSDTLVLTDSRGKMLYCGLSRNSYHSLALCGTGHTGLCFLKNKGGRRLARTTGSQFGKSGSGGSDLGTRGRILGGSSWQSTSVRHRANEPLVLASSKPQRSVDVYYAGNVVASLGPHTGGIVLNTSVSPLGDRILTHTQSTLYLWSAYTFQCEARLDALRATGIVRAEFDPLGTSIVSLLKNGTLVAWNAQSLTRDCIFSVPFDRSAAHVAHRDGTTYGAESRMHLDADRSAVAVDNLRGDVRWNESHKHTPTLASRAKVPAASDDETVLLGQLARDLDDMVDREERRGKYAAIRPTPSRTDLEPPNPASAFQTFAISPDGAHVVATTLVISGGGAVTGKAGYVMHVWTYPAVSYVRSIAIDPLDGMPVKLTVLANNVSVAVLSMAGTLRFIRLTDGVVELRLGGKSSGLVIVNTVFAPNGVLGMILTADGRAMMYRFDINQKLGKLRERELRAASRNQQSIPSFLSVAGPHATANPIGGSGDWGGGDQGGGTAFRAPLIAAVRANQTVGMLRRRGGGHTVSATSYGPTGAVCTEGELSLSQGPINDTAAGSGVMSARGGSQAARRTAREDSVLGTTVTDGDFTFEARSLREIGAAVRASQGQWLSSVERAQSAADDEAEELGGTGADSMSCGGGAQHIRFSPQLTTHQSALNKDKLTALLFEYGEYPSKYRTLIWAFVLGVPRNRHGYQRLVRRGEHPSTKSALDRFPVKSPRLRRRLVAVLSALAHHSPIFGEAPFVPEIAFPFIKVFGSDSIGCFESLLTFFMNWGCSLFATFPLPAVDILTDVESLLAHAQPDLQGYLREVLGMGPEAYAWFMITSLFTNRFDSAAWLKVMDHVLSNPPCFLLHVVVATLRVQEQNIVLCPNEFYVRRLLLSPVQASVNRILRMAYAQMLNLPSTLQPTSMTPSHSFARALPEGNVDLLRGVVSIPRHSHEYPLFDRYPEYVVNYQEKERQRILEEEKSHSAKVMTVQRLQRQTQSLRMEAAKWEMKRAEMDRLEVGRQDQLTILQARHSEEARTLDAALRASLMENASSVEEARAVLERVRQSVNDGDEKRSERLVSQQREMLQDSRATIQDKQVTVELQREIHNNVRDIQKDMEEVNMRSEDKRSRVLEGEVGAVDSRIHTSQAERALLLLQLHQQEALQQQPAHQAVPKTGGDGAGPRGSGTPPAQGSLQPAHRAGGSSPGSSEGGSASRSGLAVGRVTRTRPRQLSTQERELVQRRDAALQRKVEEPTASLHRQGEAQEGRAGHSCRDARDATSVVAYSGHYGAELSSIPLGDGCGSIAPGQTVAVRAVAAAPRMASTVAGPRRHQHAVGMQSISPQAPAAAEDHPESATPAPSASTGYSALMHNVRHALRENGGMAGDNANLDTSVLQSRLAEDDGATPDTNSSDEVSNFFEIADLPLPRAPEEACTRIWAPLPRDRQRELRERKLQRQATRGQAVAPNTSPTAPTASVPPAGMTAACETGAGVMLEPVPRTGVTTDAVVDTGGEAAVAPSACFVGLPRHLAISGGEHAPDDRSYTSRSAPGENTSDTGLSSVFALQDTVRSTDPNSLSTLLRGIPIPDAIALYGDHAGAGYATLPLPGMGSRSSSRTGEEDASTASRRAIVLLPDPRTPGLQHTHEPDDNLSQTS